MSSEHGVFIGAGTVRFERVLPGPIERVWAYLTESEKRARWLAAGPMELRAGGRVELRFRHAELSPRAEPTPDRYRGCENGAVVSGRVTRCDPPRLLSYSWGEEDGEDSEVAFELTARGAEVVLVLTHRRLRGRPMILSVAAGWHAHLGILVDHLSGRAPQPFWSAHAEAERAYEERLPAAG